MSGIPDAPWIGLCREEYEDRCRLYDEDEEDYLATKADDDYKAAKEEEAIERVYRNE